MKMTIMGVALVATLVSALALLEATALWRLNDLEEWRSRSVEVVTQQHSEVKTTPLPGTSWVLPTLDPIIIPSDSQVVMYGHVGGRYAECYVFSMNGHPLMSSMQGNQNLGSESEYRIYCK